MDIYLNKMFKKMMTFSPPEMSEQHSQFFSTV